MNGAKASEPEIDLGVGIQIEAVSKGFRLAKGTELKVFSRLDIQIEPGSFTAILGPSGCGKSTLLRLIAGLESLDGGQIRFGRENAGTKPRIGFMLQQYPSLPWLTVSQNIELGLETRTSQVIQPQSRERALYYLSQVGLFGWHDAYPRELSGGMLQRLALARTLAMEPDIVLLDEPLGALDALTRHDLQSLIRDLHAEERKTFVMVTHDVEEGFAVADRLIVLGPAGTGVLYDSSATDLRLDRDELVRLLRGTHVTFAAGTWSGYAPVQKAAVEHGTRIYDLWRGMSDHDRVGALRSGRAAGALMTIQSLAGRLKELEEIDPVVVHVFSETASENIAEHILIHPPAKLEGELRWALPRGGLEAAVVRRTRQENWGDSIIEHDDRASCILAVADGKADACIADIGFAKRLIPWHQRLRLNWVPLPEDVWRDLWTVLIVPQSLISEKREALVFAIRMLALDASAVSKQTAGVNYPDAVNSLALLRDGKISAAFERWGGEDLPIFTGLLEDIVRFETRASTVLEVAYERL